MSGNKTLSEMDGEQEAKMQQCYAKHGFQPSDTGDDSYAPVKRTSHILNKLLIFPIPLDEAYLKSPIINQRCDNYKTGQFD